MWNRLHNRVREGCLGRGRLAFLKLGWGPGEEGEAQRGLVSKILLGWVAGSTASTVS